jgi:hypothetical protein
MGLRNLLVRVLSRGNPPVRDENELVEITVLTLIDATLLTEELRSRGLHAQCEQTFNVATGVLSDGRVLVPRAEFAHAQAIARRT